MAPSDGQSFGSAVADAADGVRAAYAKTDPDVQVTVERVHGARDAWTAHASQNLLDVIALIPSGPLAMSPDFDGLVETSTSLAVAATQDGQLALLSLTRTSNEAALPDVLGALDAAGRLAGGRLEVKPNYPGWQPDLDSPVLATARRVFRETLGEEAIVSAVHAGLESAVIAGKVSQPLDMLSFGPQIEFPHSPDERVSIPTVETFWTLLVATLDDLSRPDRR